LCYHARDRFSQSHPPGPVGASSVDVALDHEEAEPSSKHLSRTAATIMAVSVIFYVFLLAPSLFFAIFPPIRGPGYFIILQTWSFITIGVSTLLALISFLPQIYYTWTLKQLESLSITTISMQVPAYFLLVASLALRFGSPSDAGNYFTAYNVWVNYLITDSQEGILLGLSIYLAYAMPENNRLSEENGHENTHERADSITDEQTPLLLAWQDEAST
jgi:PQ loop repeat